MPNTAKREAIRKAYESFFHESSNFSFDKIKQLVDSDGWYKYNEGCEINICTVGFDQINGRYRPKSLQGLENNNGWIRIESEEDLPPENSGLYFVYDSKDVGIARMSTIMFRCLTSNEVYSNVTHYQPIVKPENPIY